jgi:hypothetical protein
MIKLIPIDDISSACSPSSANKVLERGVCLCKMLEAPNILYFPFIPFDLSEDEKNILLDAPAAIRKKINRITYKPYFFKKNKKKSREEIFYNIMQQCFFRTYSFLAKLLTPYSTKWEMGFTHFCGSEEKHIKNDNSLHFDMFDSHPASGHRILRFCMNISNDKTFKWETSQEFSHILENLVSEKELPFSIASSNSFIDALKLKLIKYFGLPLSYRTSYDVFLEKLCHYLSKSENFQKSAKTTTWYFPPNSCWVLFTDSIAHLPIYDDTVLAQTFFIPHSAMLDPKKAPISLVKEKEKLLNV